MSDDVDKLWKLTLGRPYVDADELARAIECAAKSADLDTRTRILIRDSLGALEHHWGEARLRAWLENLQNGRDIRSLATSAPPDHGFPSLTRRLVHATKPEVVMQLLRELSEHVDRPTELVIGGSIALMLQGHLTRHTEDIDIVDELPATVREQHALLESLAVRYGLRLAHFQSHFLPSGWEKRVHSLSVMGKLNVQTVDAYDIAVGKLFSLRAKDRDDLRALLPRLDKSVLETRVRDSTAALQAEQKLKDAAVANWYVLFGEDLPV